MKKQSLYLFVLLMGILATGNVFAQSNSFAEAADSFINGAGNLNVHPQSARHGSPTTEDTKIPARASALVDFALDSINDVILVIDLDPSPNPQITNVIQGFFPGGIVEYATTIDGYPLGEEVRKVFLLLGIYSNNYVLTEDDATVITNWIDSYDNRRLYMEGGDTWFFDPPTSLHAYFNIDPISDGSSDLANVYGINNYWAQFNWIYQGENYWIDHIEAIPPAINVCENPDFGYFNAVAYDAGTYKTVGASYEVTGLDDGTGSFDMGIAAILGFFGYPPISPVGSLEGYLTNCLTGSPIEGATVSIYGYTVTTAADGYFYFESIPVGTWELNYSAPNYCPNNSPEMVIIEEDLTTTVNICLAPAQFEVAPDSIYVVLEPNSSTNEEITLSNPGVCDVSWMTSITLLNNYADEMFDVLMDVPDGIGGGEAGIETDGNFIYTSMWNGAGEFQRYTMDGTWVETITVSGADGCRDMAYDGTYFYGGDASTTIFEMDLANATMISTFISPAACRAIAYNENDDAFYCNNWSDDITKFDKAGNNLGSFAVSASAASYYGFAYDGYSDGNPYLWGYSQTGATSNELIQMELPSGNETGLTFDVGSVTNVGAGIAGGLAIDEHISPTGLYAFLGTSQNENIWALELGGAAGSVWLTIDPNFGSLLPGGSETMDVNFDATDLLPGIYTGTINFSTSPDAGNSSVYVTLQVQGLVAPTNLDGSYNCTNIQLNWEMPAGIIPDSFNVYKDGILIDNVITENFIDLSVYPEIEYCYQITAVYEEGESMPTPEVCITVPLPDDLEPINQECMYYLNGYLISWETPNCCISPKGYNVYRDGFILNDTLISELYYFDEVYQGFYEYTVTAVYYFVESDPVLTFCYTGVEDYSSKGVEIYPNPIDSWFVIRSERPLHYTKIYNNLGTEIIEQELNGAESLIDLTTYSPGVYLLKIAVDDEVVLRKIILK